MDKPNINFQAYNTLFQKLKRAKRREKKAKMLLYELVELRKKEQEAITKLKQHYAHTTGIEKLRKNPPE